MEDSIKKLVCKRDCIQDMLAKFSYLFDQFEKLIDVQDGSIRKYVLGRINLELNNVNQDIGKNITQLNQHVYHVSEAREDYTNCDEYGNYYEKDQ